MQRVRLRTPTLPLWRARGELQLGLGEAPLLLAGVPEQLAAAVTLLAAPLSPAELATLVPKLDKAWLAWLLAELQAAGLLEPVRRHQVPPVVVSGTGPLAARVLAALQDAGMAARPGPGSGVLGTSLEDVTGDSGLVIVAGSTAEPDRSLTDALFRAGQAHLIVRLEPDRAVVGPLVLPGRTPCVRCLDLAHCRLDAGWPHLLAQLCLAEVAAEPVLLGWAVATTLAQVRAWQDGHTPQVAGGALELVQPGYEVRARSWPAQAGCGCLVPLG